MNIGFITHQFPGIRAGGIGTYTLEVTAALAAAGHSIHLFTFPIPADLRATLPKNLHLHELPDLSNPYAQALLPPTLAAALTSDAAYRLALAYLLSHAASTLHKTHPLDLLEAPEYEALALPLMLDPALHSPTLPIITHLHLCSAVARAGNAAPTTPEDTLIDTLEFAAITHATATCAPTQNIVTETRRFTPIPTNPAILPHPMQLPTTPPTPLTTQSTILFVGRLEPRKGTDLMPPAFNHFLDRNPNAAIRLVGPDTQWGGGSTRDRILAQLTPHARRRITFAGEKSPADIHQEFANCRFSLCPSLLESFGYVAAESLAAGRPVIVSSDIGATEVVADAGLTFPKGDPLALAAAMETLWRNPALTQSLALRAHARAQHLFSPQNTLTARLALYQSVIAHARTTPRPLDPTLWPALLQKLAAPQASLSPGARVKAALDRHAPNTRFYLYGAGRFTARLLVENALWEAAGHHLLGLIDDHPRFTHGGRHLGLPVLSHAAAADLTQGDVILLATDTLMDQLWQNTLPLRQRGVAVYPLFPLTKC